MRNENLKNILVVDDCPNDQKLVTLLLQRSFDCIIHIVDSLTAAKAKLQSEKFDIITLDGMLPCFINGGFGYTLIPFIKDCQNSECKIIMISGERTHVETGMKLGADYGLNKYDLKKEIKLNQNFELV